MKYTTILIIYLLLGIPGNAQHSVGLGTSSSALLELNSSSKGLLVPRMSSSVRISIPTPHEGLVVYDTTSNRLYIFQDGIWRFTINSAYWTKSTSRDALYNTTDSIGIGTSIPTARLDVNGDMRVRSDVDVTDDMTITTSGSAGILHATGSASIGSAMYVTGNIIAGGDIYLNNTAATLQLRQSGTNMAFFQLSGDNLRLGTNSGNTNGDFYLRMNGDYMVWVSNKSDLALLRFSGSVNYGKLVMGEKLSRVASPGSNTLTVMYGRIFSDGNIGTMWPNVGDVTRVSLGVYDITTNISGVSSKGTIIVSPTNTTVARLCTGRYISAGVFRVEIFSITGSHVDNDFYFMITDPLN